MEERKNLNCQNIQRKGTVNGNKKIGLVMILLGVLILLYKRAGFYSFGGYVDNSWENIIISLLLIIIGIIFLKRNKANK